MSTLSFRRKEGPKRGFTRGPWQQRLGLENGRKKDSPRVHSSDIRKTVFPGDVAMGQNPVPVNIPIPTEISTKMGGEITYPKMGSQSGFDNHSHVKGSPKQ